MCAVFLNVLVKIRKVHAFARNEIDIELLIKFKRFTKG